jgi:arylsulfatase A-like enzyme
MDRVAGSPRGREAFWDPKIEYWNVPLLRDTEIIERPADQKTITKRYAEEAVRFIRQNKDRPFFVYLAHSMPHVPLFASGRFKGRSLRGLFGDVVEEIDWSVGQVLDTLRDLDLDDRTLVAFCSDNGPWLIFNEHGGSAGLLRDGKGSTWKGGMREPTIFRWPGTVPPRTVHDMGSTMDLLPTFAKLAGADVPGDRILDGMDISPALLGTGPSPRGLMFFYRGVQLYAVRKGPFKAHFITRPAYGAGKAEPHDPPLLYHLGHDPSEKFDVAEKHPEVIAEIRKLVEAHQAALEPGPPQLELLIQAKK